MSAMHVQVVTPERVVVSRDAEMVIARALDGDIGILPRHIPLITVLAPGVVRIKGSGAETSIAVGGGFMEVSADSSVTILAETAELGTEIDIDRARQARDRALKRLAEQDKLHIDVQRSEVALKKALARLEASGRDQ